MPLRPLLAALAVAGTLGCAARDARMPAAMRGIAWEWIGLTTPAETIDVPAPERYTLTFLDERRIALRADCNRGSATYELGSDGRISFGPIALTRMACPPGSLSDRYIREVERAATYAIIDGTLLLQLPLAGGTLRFERTE